MFGLFEACRELLLRSTFKLMARRLNLNFTGRVLYTSFGEKLTSKATLASNYQATLAQSTGHLKDNVAMRRTKSVGKKVSKWPAPSNSKR
jgi:hypothetical protein